jgi:hypothetical protein
MVVHRLPSAIQNAELSRQDLIGLGSEITEFRLWVEVRRKASRQLILSEA